MSDIESDDGALRVPEGMDPDDPDSFDRLFAELYHDLRSIAARQLGNERSGHTLQPTALVNEAYLRLVRSAGPARARGRLQFLALAARAMRRALVDHARGRRRLKRGGDDLLCVTLDPDAGPVEGGESRTMDVLAVNFALEKLERLHPRHARVVELRMFSGLTIAETAAVLRVSTDTVEDDWAMARTWLWRELQPPLR